LQQRKNYIMDGKWVQIFNIIAHHDVVID
jgi:hypothetical protein